MGLVLGFFDGVHIGHRAVINSAMDGGRVIVLTFEDSPAKFFSCNAKYIFSRENSVKKLKDSGVDEVILQNFSELHTQSAKDYISNIIDKYHPKTICTGFNYTFGAKKIGTPDLLRRFQEKYGYKYICVPPVTEKNEIVSSTLIKKYIESGDIDKANKLLGSNFILEGKVIRGAQLGRKIGFPTANFVYPDEIVEMPYGVYVVKTDYNYGIMNYGVKPTLYGDKKPIAEVHLFDFDGDLYDKNIRAEVITKLRDEKKFEDIEELKEQIQKDKEACLKLSL